VVVKGSIFWDITPCSPLKANWRFEGKCRFLLHGRRICQARNQHEAGSKHLSDLVSQKIELFIVTAVRASNEKNADVCYSGMKMFRWMAASLDACFMQVSF
jgi:hypothetical protein